MSNYKAFDRSMNIMWSFDTHEENILIKIETMIE